jgi:Zn finger protein HypA/HybF involved in hydrogenase expression
MHEAALARTIAIELREARKAGLVGPPRVLVWGGHDEPEDFDAALLLHLVLAAPELGGGVLEIVHVPVDRLCSGCGRQFNAGNPLAVCPTCGCAALPTATSEEVELEWPARKAV